MIGPSGALCRDRLDELQCREVAIERMLKELLGRYAGIVLTEEGTFLLFLDQMREADEIPRRRVLDADLFLLLLHPAAAPAPQVHWIADDLRGPFQSQLALE